MELKEDFTKEILEEIKQENSLPEGMIDNEKIAKNALEDATSYFNKIISGTKHMNPSFKASVLCHLALKLESISEQTPYFYKELIENGGEGHCEFCDSETVLTKKFSKKFCSLSCQKQYQNSGWEEEQQKQKRFMNDFWNKVEKGKNQRGDKNE